MNLLKQLIKNKATISLSDSRRIVTQGAVKVNGELCDDFNREVAVGDLIEVGKTKKFVVEVEVTMGD